MTPEESSHEKKSLYQNLYSIIEECLLYVDAVGWIVLTLFFLLATVCAFAAPKYFEPLSAGIGFLGITLATLALFLYVADKIRYRKNEREIEERLKNESKIEERLKNIEQMVEKWDFY